MADYLPKTDGALRDFAVNFSALITANPATYGLTAPDATTVANAVALYTAALTLAVDPATKTKATVADKDAKRAAMCGILRFYAMTIKQNKGVTNEEKVALGLHINDTTRSAIPAPTTQPICSVVSATPLQHLLRFADAASPARRAKPEGVLAAELYIFVAPAGTAPPVSPDADKDADYYGLATRSSLAVDLDPADVGKTATYYARWVTRTGRVGPWSAPVSMTVAA